MTNKRKKVSKAYLNSKPWKLAILACNKGNCESLKSLCLERLEKYPDDEAALTNLSVLYLKEGRYKEGIALCEKGLKLHPNLFSLLVNISGALCEVRQYEKAYAYSSRAIAIDPTNPDAMANHSVACNRVAKIKEAEATALQGLKYAPDHFGLLTSLASAYKQLGKMKQAIELRKKALLVKPEEYLNHTNLLLDLLYYEQATVNDIVEAAHNFSQVFEAPFISSWPLHTNTSDPYRKIKLVSFHLIYVIMRSCTLLNLCLLELIVTHSSCIVMIYILGKTWLPSELGVMPINM
jgi:tetratricopeptide (TPR) repeat protein